MNPYAQQESIFSRLFGYMAMFVVFLNMTNAYTLVSAFTNASLSSVGIASIVLLGLHILVNMRVLFRVYSRNKAITFFAIVFTIIPALSIFLAPVPLYSLAGYSFLCLFIFTSSMIWMHKNGWQAFAKMLVLAWMANVGFTILSYFYPMFFEGIAYMQAEAKNLNMSITGSVRVGQMEHGRAFGLHMQANRAATALVTTQILLHTIVFHNKIYIKLIITALTLFAIILTGSRAGIALFCLVIFVSIVSELIMGTKKNERVISGFNTVFYYMAGSICLATIIFVAKAVQVKQGSELSAFERITNSLNISKLEQDVSVMARINAQLAYANKIMESPLLGNGLGAYLYETDKGGSLERSSHNTMLEMAYSNGIPIVVASYGFLLYLALIKQSKSLRRFFHYDLSWTLVIFYFVASFASGTLFDYRQFPVIMAFWITLLYFPERSKERLPRHPAPSYMQRGPAPQAALPQQNQPS